MRFESSLGIHSLLKTLEMNLKSASWPTTRYMHLRIHTNAPHQRFSRVLRWGRLSAASNLMLFELRRPSLDRSLLGFQRHRLARYPLRVKLYMLRAKNWRWVLLENWNRGQVSKAQEYLGGCMLLFGILNKETPLATSKQVLRVSRFLCFA